jgi:hypothetical protein
MSFSVVPFHRGWGRIASQESCPQRFVRSFAHMWGINSQMQSDGMRRTVRRLCGQAELSRRVSAYMAHLGMLAFVRSSPLQQVPDRESGNTGNSGENNQRGGRTGIFWLAGGVLLACGGHSQVVYAKALDIEGRGQLSDEELMVMDPVLKPYFEKNNRPTTRTIEEKIACFNRLIELGREAALQTKGKDIVVVIGTTQAGKSTLINFLHGCKMQKTAEGRIEVSPQSPEKEIVKIGTGRNSCTIIPKQVSESVLTDASLEISDPSDVGSVVQRRETLVLYDMPGFVEQRGFEVGLANACNIRQIIKEARSVRVVMVVAYSTIEAAAGDGWKETALLLSDRFGGHLSTQNLKLIVTQEHGVSPQRIKEAIRDYATQIEGCPDFSSCVDVYNPLNPRDRNRLLQEIQAQASVAPSVQIALSAREMQGAEELAQHLADDVGQLLTREQGGIALERVKFSSGLALLGAAKFIETHSLVQKAVENAFDRKYLGSIGSGAVALAHKTKTFDAYKSAKQPFFPFVDFTKLDKALYDHIEGDIVRHLREQTALIQRAKGDAAVIAHRQYQTEKKKFFPYIDPKSARGMDDLRAFDAEAVRCVHEATADKDNEKTARVIGGGAGLVAFTTGLVVTTAAPAVAIGATVCLVGYGLSKVTGTRLFKSWNV